MGDVFFGDSAASGAATKTDALSWGDGCFRTASSRIRATFSSPMTEVEEQTRKKIHFEIFFQKRKNSKEWILLDGKRRKKKKEKKKQRTKERRKEISRHRR